MIILQDPKAIIFYDAGLSFIITLVPTKRWFGVMLLLCLTYYLFISSCLKHDSHMFDSDICHRYIVTQFVMHLSLSCNLPYNLSYICHTFSLCVTIITRLPNCETFAFISVYYMDSPMMSNCPCMNIFTLSTNSLSSGVFLFSGDNWNWFSVKDDVFRRPNCKYLLISLTKCVYVRNLCVMCSL